MVLDTKVNFRRLHADLQTIAYGRKSIALDQVEWVRYRSVHTTTKKTFGLVKEYDVNWYFSVGAFPVRQATMIDLMVMTLGKDTPPPDAWTFLVNLSQQHLEPRLLAELVGRVHAGRAVEVAGLRVHPDGFDSDKVSLPWQSVGGTRLAGGKVWIYRKGGSQPVLAVPLQNPNAVLVPRLFTALAP